MDESDRKIENKIKVRSIKHVKGLELSNFVLCVH